MLAVMSTHCLQKLNHMFVISNNTWHKCGILGKKGERQDPYILCWEEKGKRIEMTKQIPSLLTELTAGLCVLLGSGQSLLNRHIFLILRFHLQCFPPPLSHEAERTLKYLKGISGKNGYFVVTVRE